MRNLDIFLLHIKGDNILNMISKELFVEVINDMERAERYQSDLNDFFRSHDTDGYIFQPDCSVSVLRLLHNFFGKADENDWISYFCFELNFGKAYKPGCVTDKNNNNIDLSNAESLYDFLVSNM